MFWLSSRDFIVCVSVPRLLLHYFEQTNKKKQTTNYTESYLSNTQQQTNKTSS